MDMKTKRIGALFMGLAIIGMLAAPLAMASNAGYLICSQATDNEAVLVFCEGSAGAGAGWLAAVRGAQLGGEIGSFLGGTWGLIIGAGLGAA